MELRKLIARDTAAIKQLHAAMNLGYELPLADHGGDLRRTFFVRTGIFDEKRLVAAVLGRLTSEAYLKHSPSAQKRLQGELNCACTSAGYRGCSGSSLENNRLGYNARQNRGCG